MYAVAFQNSNLRKFISDLSESNVVFSLKLRKDFLL